MWYTSWLMPPSGASKLSTADSVPDRSAPAVWADTDSRNHQMPKK